ncbi:hypothetical protein N9Z27_01680 [Alphaproteobacteria bacterium]|nr:hypothetical protein [Alphaproteobacteria bacterium]
MILSVLLGINILFISGYYLMFAPDKIIKERELKTLNSKLSTMRSDIAQMQVDFDQFGEQQEKFERLKEVGFFNDQGRRQAEDVFEEIQEKSGVIAASVKLSPGKSVEDEDATKANHILLESPLQINIDAMEDSDIFRYIFYIQEYFPGHISVKRVSLKRERDLSRDILKNIANQKQPKMVSAQVEMTWRTMIPKDSATGGNKG